MNDLVEDLSANNITDTEQTASLVQLTSDMQVIANEHVGRAASMLRELTAVSDDAPSQRNPVPAIHMVNSAARELALLVFQLGFNDAADVMARELHATAQTQAALRLRTIMLGQSDADHRAGNVELAKAQTQLAAWCTRLLSEAPRNKESTSNDAMVAFNLSRLTKKLLRAGTTDGMREAASLIPQAESEKSGPPAGRSDRSIAQCGVPTAAWRRIRSTDHRPRPPCCAGQGAKETARGNRRTDSAGIRQ